MVTNAIKEGRIGVGRTKDGTSIAIRTVNKDGDTVNVHLTLRETYKLIEELTRCCDRVRYGV